MTKAELIAQNAALLSLVSDLRIALGDDGKRMQPELVEHARELRGKAEAYSALRAKVDAGVKAAIDAAAKAME